MKILLILTLSKISQIVQIGQLLKKLGMPTGTGTEGGWHFFRGKGWVDQEGDIAIQITTSQIHAWCRQGGGIRYI